MMMYPSPLITVKALTTPGEAPVEGDLTSTYTKHYYIGNQRIASTLGTTIDLGLFPWWQMNPPDTPIQLMANESVLMASTGLINTYLALGQTIQLEDPVQEGASDGFTPDEKKYDTFWYHPDHLGSSSYISNRNNEVSQHMEYLPFGELLVEEHKNSYNTPYKFNAKELDEETGNYYYGARYYDPKFSIWLSVDPLAEKFPGWSPYNYVLNNPIIFIDPDGNEPTPAALKLAAIRLGVSVAAIRAVYKVETGGNAFRSNGDPKVLFERHYFHRNTGGRYDKSHPSISNRSMGGYGKYSEQISKLNLATSLDEEAGYKSASYGGFQIMGENYKKAGYDNVVDFAEAMMSKNEDKHLDAFTNFIMDNDNLLEALQDKDWETFAKIYNGPKYEKNNYDVKMKEAYEEFLKTPLESGETNPDSNNFPPPVDSSLEGAPKQ